MLVMSWSFAAGFVAAAVACQFLRPWIPGNLVLSAFFIAMAVFFVRQFGTGRIELYRDAVVLDGWWRRRREVPLTSIKSVEPGPHGLFFGSGDFDGIGGPSQIGAKGLGLHLLKVRARGDRIAETIMAAVQAKAARSKAN